MSELWNHSDEKNDDDEKITITTTAAAARIERTLLLYVEVSETSNNSDDLRMNVALFLKWVTAEEAIAEEETVNLLK